MHEIPYIGDELTLFQHATNWKSYYGRLLKPYIKKKVLEVGAGMGGTTAFLCDGNQEEWVCLEPDPALFEELQKKINDKNLPPCCTAIKGTTGDLAGRQFDTVLYIDVIEHIEQDGEELNRAWSLLTPGGSLIVLVPANQYFYSPFDQAIGHYRRYNKKRLLAVEPEGMELKKITYLDAMGYFASAVNKFFLKQKYPTPQQIGFWDKKLIRLSKLIDPAIGHLVGKTLIAVWEKK